MNKRATNDQISLRDQFAGQVMNGIVAGVASRTDAAITAETAKAWAKVAYRVADAMVEQRAENE